MTILFSLLLGLSLSASSKPADPLRPLKDTLIRIQKSKMVDFRLEKKVTSEVLQTEKTFTGRAYLAGPLFRFETSKPEKSLVVFDGKTLWIVQYPDKELGGPTQVLKGRLQGKQKDQMILTELLTQGKLLQSFEIKKTGEEKNVAFYEGEPKEKSLNLKKVAVKIDIKKKTIAALEYVDDVGNKTALDPVVQKNLGEKKASLFRYKPEPGAQVNEL